VRRCRRRCHRRRRRRRRRRCWSRRRRRVAGIASVAAVSSLWLLQSPSFLAVLLLVELVWPTITLKTPQHPSTAYFGWRSQHHRSTVRTDIAAQPGSQQSQQPRWIAVDQRGWRCRWLHIYIRSENGILGLFLNEFQCAFVRVDEGESNLSP